MNRKDLDNLMGIYLDAVFFPLLREKDFHQEGHRFEFSDPQDSSSPLEIKGVVFNEMKGAMADPSSLLGRRLTRALFPETCYGENSGGEPLNIPDLTWKQLRQFHQTYYHPSNSWFFTYGDMPLDEHLARIEELALSKFEALNVSSEIPLETRLTSPVRVEETFPINSPDDLAGRSMFQLAWLISPIEDTFERTAFGILTSLLIGNPAAPLYQALINSKLGENLCPGTGYHDDYRDTFFAAGLQGTDPDKVDAIEDLVLKTLEEAAREGFPEERVSAALHQHEFAAREVSGDQYPYGLSLLMRTLGPWLHADDPVSPLQIEKNLQKLREATQDSQFFPELIRKHLLDNPHRVSMLLRPDPGHAEREEQALQQRLDQFAAELDEAGRQQLVAAATELANSQDEQDDTSCLPTLELSDVVREELPVNFEKTCIADRSVFWFDQPTNGITYLTLQFDTSGLTSELRPFLPLFCALLPQVGAAGQDYLEMARRLSASTGGVRLAANLMTDPTDLDQVKAVVDLRGKALTRNLEAFGDILADMLSAPDFDDLARLKTVIGQVKVSMENSIAGSGHSFAARSAASGLTPAAQLREEWSGLTQLTHIREAAARDDQGVAELAGIFREIAQQLLSRQNVVAAVTAEQKNHEHMQKPLCKILEALDTSPPKLPAETSAFLPKKKVVGWEYNIPVAYVTKVFRTQPFVHPDAAPLTVLSKLLRANFLHREIREKGGAYGGLAGNNSEDGLFSMLSYRDPHMMRTLDVYRKAVDWACSGDFSDEMVKEAILAVFGELDRPLSPGGRGYHEFHNQQQGLTLEMRQAQRDALLAVTGDDLARVARTWLAEGWEQRSTGILGGDEMFAAANDDLEKLDMQIRKL